MRLWLNSHLTFSDSAKFNASSFAVVLLIFSYLHTEGLNSRRTMPPVSFRPKQVSPDRALLLCSIPDIAHGPYSLSKGKPFENFNQPFLAAFPQGDMQ